MRLVHLKSISVHVEEDLLEANVSILKHSKWKHKAESVKSALPDPCGLLSEKFQLEPSLKPRMRCSKLCQTTLDLKGKGLT